MNFTKIIKKGQDQQFIPESAPLEVSIKPFKGEKKRKEKQPKFQHCQEEFWLFISYTTTAFIKKYTKKEKFNFTRMKVYSKSLDKKQMNK